MTEIKIGDKIVDNDPRICGGRCLIVTSIDGERVTASDGRYGTTKISIRRIFTDGKPRRTGWSLIASAQRGHK